MRDILYILCSYLAGSLLFARINGFLFHVDVTKETKDGNPGSANAFQRGGLLCGSLTLCGDLLKGFLPVFLYLNGPLAETETPADTFASFLPFVLVAPVLGHIFPVFFSFRGGKGIATTFGVLLGLAPNLVPALTLAFFFLFFSLVVRISPHYYRTIVTYACSEIALFFLSPGIPCLFGFTLITVAVGLRLILSKEERNSFQVSLLWTR